MNNVDKRLLVYKPISITLGFDWENTTLDQRAQMRWDYIQEQKKLDPNYVGYDFPEHFRSLHGGRAVKSTESVTFDLLVSTIGQLISARYEDKIWMTFGGKSHKGYLVTAINELDEARLAQVHRIVACTFIPIPEELFKLKNKLIINHKNDIVTCNHVTNLEWTTLRGNTIKAVQTGLIQTTCFKLTVTRPGELYGNEYYFFGKMDLDKYGFSHTPVLESTRTNKPYLCGIWSEITKEEIKDKSTGMSESDLEIIRNKRFGRRDANACVGTIVTEGPCKGDKFAIFSTAMLVSYGFGTSAIYAAIKGKLKISGGCTWERMTREEAKDLPIGLTPEQLEHISKTRAKKTK